MEDEWTTVISGDRLVKFTYADLPEGTAFLTAQIAGHAVVYSVILRQLERPFNREGVERHFDYECPPISNWPATRFPAASDEFNDDAGHVVPAVCCGVPSDSVRRLRDATSVVSAETRQRKGLGWLGYNVSLAVWVGDIDTV
jgi:hypothetical protein